MLAVWVFEFIDSLFMPSVISDNGKRFESLGLDGVFSPLCEFSTQTYTDLGGACGAQAYTIKCY